MKSTDLMELVTAYILLEETSEKHFIFKPYKKDSRSENEKNILNMLEKFFNTDYFKEADKNDSDILFSEFLKYQSQFQIQNCGRMKTFFESWSGEKNKENEKNTPPVSPLVRHSVVVSPVNAEADVKNKISGPSTF